MNELLLQGTVWNNGAFQRLEQFSDFVMVLCYAVRCSTVHYQVSNTVAKTLSKMNTTCGQSVSKALQHRGCV
eukprot:5677087-Amphidinium_carterae.1